MAYILRYPLVNGSCKLISQLNVSGLESIHSKLAVVINAIKGDHGSLSLGLHLLKQPHIQNELPVANIAR